MKRQTSTTRCVLSSTKSSARARIFTLFFFVITRTSLKDHTTLIYITKSFWNTNTNLLFDYCYEILNSRFALEHRYVWNILNLKIITVHVAFLACKPMARKGNNRASSSSDCIYHYKVKTKTQTRTSESTHTSIAGSTSLRWLFGGIDDRCCCVGATKTATYSFQSKSRTTIASTWGGPRSTALPRNPCCGGTAPSPETLKCIYTALVGRIVTWC